MRTQLNNYLKATTIVEIVPMRALVQSKFSMRGDLGSMDDLILSIRNRGLLEPIIVRPMDSKFEIVAGHRRYAACRAIGRTEIAAIVLDLTDREAYEVALEENLQRKSLDPMEEATTFKLYVSKYGYGSMSELAKRIGKSEEYVSHRIALLDLPLQIQESVRRRLLSSSDAWEISRLRNPTDQTDIAKAALKEKMTVRQIRRVVNLANEGLPIRRRSNGSSPDPDARSADEQKNLKLKKAALIVLRSALIRIDALAEDLGSDGTGTRDELMSLRYSLHEMIDGFMTKERINRRDATKLISFIMGDYCKSQNVIDAQLMSKISSTSKYSIFDDFPPLALMNYHKAIEHKRAYFQSIRSSNGRILDAKVKFLEGCALVTLLWRYDMSIGDVQHKAGARVTVVLERMGEEWRIVHEHWSPAEYELDSIRVLKESQPETKKMG